jgi:hypothetical protein
MEESLYHPFKEFPEIKALFDQHPCDNESETVIVMGTCELTPLGKQFKSVAIPIGVSVITTLITIYLNGVL